MRRMWCRLRAMLRRVLDGGARDAELSEELRAFVEHDAESKIRSGMTPEDARRAALIELGGAEQVKEHVREARAGARWESIFRDIRYAMRSLGQARGFSCSVIGNLSLGLAATIVAFAFINGALLRPFPGVRDQDRLVTLGILERTPFGSTLPLTAMADYPDVFRALREGMTSLEGLASVTESDVAVTLPQPRSFPAEFVSPNYFDVLGVQPEIGRTFASEGGQAESAVAIIGHALWTQEFGRDPSVAGRPIQVGGQIFQIVGVAPQGFRGTTESPTQTGVELWLPIASWIELAIRFRSGGATIVFLNDTPGERLIRYVGRMRNGVRADRVETELAVMARRVGTPADDPAAPVIAEVSSLSRLNDRTNAGQIVAIIVSIPLLVLAIACVNAANLFLVRASRRRREVAVRLALGASRLRLVRQLVIESLVLAIGAAVLALPLAWWGLQWVAAFMTIPMPLDGTVAAAALVTAFLTALGFGLVPALQAAGQHPSAALGTSPAGSGGTRAESRGRRVLVAGQVALSLALLATGFQLTSALESLAEPPGTDPDRLLLASFNLAQLRFSSAESDAFYAALLDGVSRLPGVGAAGLSSRNLGQGWDPFRPRQCRSSGSRQWAGRAPSPGQCFCRWRLFQGPGARPRARPGICRGRSARDTRRGDRHRTSGVSTLQRCRTRPEPACVDALPWRSAGRPPDRGYRGVAPGTVRRGSPGCFLPLALPLADPAWHRAHASRPFRRSGGRPGAGHPRSRGSARRSSADPGAGHSGPDDSRGHPATTHAGEGGGTPGHRGAPARQRRPVRSDLL